MKIMYMLNHFVPENASNEHHILKNNPGIPTLKVVSRTAEDCLVFPFSSLSLAFLFGQACLQGAGGGEVKSPDFSSFWSEKENCV